MLVSQSNAAIHWMRELGIKWEIDSHVVIDGRYYFEPGLVIHPVGGVGGGLGQLGNGARSPWAWASSCATSRGSKRYSATTGISKASWSPIPTKNTKSKAGQSFFAPAAFRRMRKCARAILAPNADLMKVRGSRHDTGEVLMMTLAMGAKAAGHWQGAHATPIDSTYPDVEIGSKANRYGYPYSITVNTLGQRFFDEGEARHSYTYAKTGWAVLGQPGALAYQIYDQKTIPLLGNRYEFSTPIEAKSIDELAGKIGIEPTVLKHTVTEFNNAARKDVVFDATKLDGKCTEGITPKKSNWASPIDKPPYWAFSITGGVTFTFGGLQINTQAQVLNTSSNPIRGLFASGDIVGLFFHNYPSCTGTDAQRGVLAFGGQKCGGAGAVTPRGRRHEFHITDSKFQNSRERWFDGCRCAPPNGGAIVRTENIPL